MTTTSSKKREYEKDKGKFADETTIQAAVGWAAWAERRFMVGLPEFLKHVGNELERVGINKDIAYEERNRLVALLARIFPSGLAKTAIEGWSDDWHNCVYIDLPTGQASWHIHDSHMWMFEGLPPYTGEWDRHTTEEKYDRIDKLVGDLFQGVHDDGLDRVAFLKRFEKNVDQVNALAEKHRRNCKKCGSKMKPGKAIDQTYTDGTPDFAGDTYSITMSAGGPGRLVDCMKCEACGWSISGTAKYDPEDQEDDGSPE